MKLTLLLRQRPTLLRQTHLANLAYAHAQLEDFAARIARGQLRGEVRLSHAAPGAERYWASLTAQEGHQSVIEEHFTDEDVMNLADLLAFTTGATDPELTFRLEELRAKFLAPVHHELEQAGIAFDASAHPNPEPDQP